MLENKPAMYVVPETKFLYINAGYHVCYDNQQAAVDTAKEIFLKNTYFFESQNETPFIIDAGANIGLSVLYFKKLYPQASILAFEPSPMICELLKKNMCINQIRDVTVIESAVSHLEGQSYLYGEHAKEGYMLGNSLLEAWGLQRLTSDALPVHAVKLSNFIQGPVDLLKLDIEGAEQQVLTELGDKLKHIRMIYAEVHESSRLTGLNELSHIIDILKQHNFEVEVCEKVTEGVFPSETLAWCDENHPRLYFLRAKLRPLANSSHHEA